MPIHTRRDALKAAAVAASIPALLSAGGSLSAQAAGASAFTDSHTVVPLPFDSAKLDGLSKKLIDSHWQNNYAGSVRALNTIQQRIAGALADPDLPPFVFNDLKREHLLRTGSVILHELYFANLGGSSGAEAALRQTLARSFGSYETWETEYRRIAAGLGGGSGWVVLGYNLHTGGLKNYWSWDHMHSAPATMPLLVLDMYEHSYHMDYGAAAAGYVDAFFRNINWQVVGERLESVS